MTIFIVFGVIGALHAMSGYVLCCSIERRKPWERRED